MTHADPPLWKSAVIGLGGWVALVAVSIGLWFLAEAGCQAIMPERPPLAHPERLILDDDQR